MDDAIKPKEYGIKTTNKANLYMVTDRVCRLVITSVRNGKKQLTQDLFCDVNDIAFDEKAVNVDNVEPIYYAHADTRELLKEGDVSQLNMPLIMQKGDPSFTEIQLSEADAKKFGVDYPPDLENHENFIRVFQADGRIIAERYVDLLPEDFSVMAIYSAEQPLIGKRYNPTVVLLPDKKYKNLKWDNIKQFSEWPSEAREDNGNTFIFLSLPNHDNKEFTYKDIAEAIKSYTDFVVKRLEGVV